MLVVIITVPAGAVGFRLGAQVAGARGSLTGDLPDEGYWQAQSGLGAGVVAELTITSDVAVSFQPSYVPRGGSQVLSDDTVDYDFDYLSLPVIVRVTGDPLGVRGFVTAGVDVGILIEATANDETGSKDISDGLESTTIGALFGAGVMVPVKRHFLTFELRYSQGLDNIIVRDEDTTDTGIAGPSVKYRSFGLLVGFLFTLGGE